MSDLFNRRLPEIYEFLGVSGYPVKELSEESLKSFKMKVESLWETCLNGFQAARTSWAKANLELTSLESSRQPNAKAIESKAVEVAALRKNFDEAFSTMLNARRAEEITRVLVKVHEGDEGFTAWFHRALKTVEAYTPRLPK